MCHTGRGAGHTSLYLQSSGLYLVMILLSAVTLSVVAAGISADVHSIRQYGSCPHFTTGLVTPFCGLLHVHAHAAHLITCSGS
jgi:hypothetical protein